MPRNGCNGKNIVAPSIALNILPPTFSTALASPFTNASLFLNQLAWLGSKCLIYWFKPLTKGLLIFWFKSLITISEFKRQLLTMSVE